MKNNLQKTERFFVPTTKTFTTDPNVIKSWEKYYEARRKKNEDERKQEEERLDRRNRSSTSDFDWMY
ncbi:MAG: hypothetical protein LBK06_07215 [Planctomycetaceae bacterium]|jgi:hypothetical protein|nr:hypothetical protein [Planctomycetaceae bacterium]